MKLISAQNLRTN